MLGSKLLSEVVMSSRLGFENGEGIAIGGFERGDAGTQSVELGG